ncbi:ANTAR domain-containing protein [Iodobacter sp. LRB]|uniref:ANTAR domain-containing response regulator n=1 Tax=unclassified Iodobacter TaxID=235634 RepID=UPI0015D4AF7F|nr:ANTAR domain-containing protein [Iodobacter sp. BJB302]
MLRILLVNDQARSEISPSMLGSAYELLPPLHTASALWPALQQDPPDLLLINTAIPSKILLDQLHAIKRAVPVLMFAEGLNQAQIRACLQVGVSHWSDGFAAEKLPVAVMMAQVQFEQSQALQQRIGLLEQQLADRKVIDQAKGLLMDKRRLSEGEAYDTLRRQAMKQGMKLGDVARQVLAMADLLG